MEILRANEKGKPNLRERERERERDSTFSLDFSNNQTISFRRSKRKSSSSQQGLCIETGVGEFQQTPRGRGFLLLGLIFV